MSFSKITYLLLFGALMLMVKPFMGFKLLNQSHRPRIVVKAFTKRKQEYVEDSAFDIRTILKKLANPALEAMALFSLLLSILLPAIFRKMRELTDGILNHLRLALAPPLPSYILASQLII